MRIKLLGAVCVMTLATLIVLGRASRAASSASSPSNQAASATVPATANDKPSAIKESRIGPRLDPQAEGILHHTCTTLAEAKTFTFDAEVTFEQVLPRSPLKIQFAGVTDYWVRKPDALAVDYESDLGAKHFWYDGTTLTIFDAPKMMYTSTAVPASIDGMMKRAAETNNLALPLADLAMSDPCANVDKRVIFGGYIGRGDVGGVACDHLAFTESNFDWQIWIQHAGKPLPRKVVIPGCVRSSLTEWPHQSPTSSSSVLCCKLVYRAKVCRSTVGANAEGL